MVGRVLSRVEDEAERVVLVVVVLGRNYTTAALSLADGPKLDVAAAAIDSVNVVRATVASKGAFVLTFRRAGIIPAVVLEDVRLTMHGPNSEAG